MRQKELLAKLKAHADLADIRFLTPITGGYINLAYRVDTPTQSYMLKNLVDHGFTRLDRQQQFFLQQHLAELGLAPCPVWLSDDHSLHMEQWLDARPLDRQSLPIEEKIDIAVDLLVTLHRTAWQNIDNCPTLDLVGDWQHYIEYGEIGPDEGLKVKIAEAMAIVAESKDWVLCHNDVSFNHIIYDQATEQGVLLDWEYAALADRYFDLAAFVLSNQLNEQECEYCLKRYAKSSGIHYDQVKANTEKQKLVAELTMQLWTAAANNCPLTFY